MAKKKKSEGLSEDDLGNILKGHASRALGYYRDEIANFQENALKRYFGELYGDEEDGKSQVVSKDVAQVVDWALPDLMEPFVSGGHVVEFEEEDEEDTDSIEDATEYCNWVFQKDNKGFFILHDAFKDGGVQKNGITKGVWETRKEVIRKPIQGVSAEELAMLQEDPAIELEDVLDHQDGTFSAMCIKTRQRERTKLVPVPPEEFLIDKNARTIEDAKYVAHRTRKTMSELREMGFDEDKIAMLPADNDDLERDSARYKYEGFDDRENDDGDTGQDQSQREVWLYEEFVRADMDGDGVAELLQVFRVDTKLLDEPKEVGRCHMVGFCPYPIPHRFFGESLADKAMQDQRAKTSVWRQLMDNLYLANSPRTEVPERAITQDGGTIEDLLTPRVGGLIRTREAGLLREIKIPDNTGSSLAALELFDSFREQNTGVVKSSQGLTSDVIDKSATEARQMDRGAQSRKRLMARVAAEGYVTELFSLILYFEATYRKEPRKIKVGDEWVPMFPGEWSTSLRPTMKVGLGHTTSEEKLASIGAIIGMQKEGMQVGLASREHLYNAASDFVEAAGQGDVSRYFADPETTPEPEIPPDPEMVKAQQEAQIEQQKLELEREKMLAEMQLKREQMQMEADLKREQMIAEIQLKASLMNSGGSVGSPVRMGGEVG